ncbi:hypothetical protein ACQPYK_29455 [Streptosporangium sp. CA-135522]|uniref:hypothetical protein n=1 Tax=Streptosporangium sp. CA-135522 TaxID=3240072 RepID=UPI003D8CC07A
MTLLTTHAALIMVIGGGAGVFTVALVLKEGKSWPAALLAGGAAFLGVLAGADSLIG